MNAPHLTTKAIAEFFESLGAEVPDQMVEFMRVAEYVEDLGSPEWPYDLPRTAVYAGRGWYELKYTKEFLKDWDGLTKEQQKAVLHMLQLLVQNPYHKSLNTHRRKYKETNPPGATDTAVYSRASDNVRVYWEEAEKESLLFQRIIVKAG